MVELIPRKVLFGNPERVSPRLSPDGSRLAWIAPKDGVLNVWLAPVSPQAGVDWDQAEVVTDDTDRGIRTFAWAHDNKHLLYLQDTGGDENWRLHDVDLTTMTRRDLTPFDGVRTEIVAMERDFPTEVLVGLNKDNPQLHDVYRLDLTTGELTKEIVNPGFLAWLADSRLAVRGAFAPQPDGGIVIMVRDGADDDWRELLTIPAEDALTTDPVAFSADGQSLLMVSSVGEETARLIRIDLATGAQEVLAADPEADISGVRVNPDTKEPQIVVVLKDRSEYIVLDPSVADDLAAIRALHPGDPNFVSADDADATWLIAFTNDSGPIPFFAYDRATRQGSFLFEHQPALSQYTWPRWSRSRSPPATACSSTATRRSRRTGREPGCRPCSTCTAGRGPGTRGAMTPRLNGWPTAATSPFRSTSAARPGTGSRSSTRATGSGAPRCRTT